MRRSLISSQCVHESFLFGYPLILTYIATRYSVRNFLAFTTPCWGLIVVHSPSTAAAVTTVLSKVGIGPEKGRRGAYVVALDQDVNYTRVMRRRSRILFLNFFSRQFVSPCLLVQRSFQKHGFLAHLARLARSHVSGMPKVYALLFVKCNQHCLFHRPTHSC